MPLECWYLITQRATRGFFSFFDFVIRDDGVVDVDVDDSASVEETRRLALASNTEKSSKRTIVLSERDREEG